MKQNFKQKLLAGLLSVCMIFQTAGIVPVYAAENAADNIATLAEEVYAVYDGSKFCMATANAPTVPTTTEITDKTTIINLYIMGGSVPVELMSGWYTCANLKTVICADTVTTIGNNAFKDCTSLASVAMPKVTTIGEYAFFQTALTSVSMPEATQIDKYAFSKTALISVSMPKATKIGDSAFSDCKKLTSVEMPNVTNIVVEAFYGCINLASVAMPKVTKIGGGAFNGCTSLASLTLGATPPATVGENAFGNCPKTNALTIQGNTAYAADVLAAYQTAAASDGAADELWYGWKLPTALDGTGVSTSAGTLEITKGSAATTVGTENAITLTATFDKATNAGKQRALAINEVEFKDGANTLGTITTAEKNAAGKWVATLNVSTKNWALGAHNLTATFAGNHELDTSTTNEVTVTVNESYAVYDGSTFYAATAGAPSTATETVISDKKTINHLYIMGGSVPANLIGDTASIENKNLKTVTCADTVTTIGNAAFDRCTSLTSVEMPMVTGIGDYAFRNCTGLASVSMPNVTKIGSAFRNCTSLASVAVPKVTSIGDYAFGDCTALTSVSLPNVTTIGQQAFEGTKLTNAQLPKVTSIGNKAFNNCRTLASLTLGATPPTVGKDAFFSCPFSRTLTIQGNPAFKDTVLAAYKAAADGTITDKQWYGWTLPTALDGTGVSNSAGTLAVTTGNSNPTFGKSNTITLTATFDKATNAGKQRALTINEVEFKDGATVLGTATATTNADGKWVATLINVNTKDWTVGTHNLTATFAGNHELLGASTTNEVTVTINKADQAALNISDVPNKVTYGDSTFTLSTTGGSGTGTAVTYAVTTGNDVVSVVGSTGVVTVLNAGTATITATKAGDTNYNATTATTTITVNAAVPTIAWADAAETLTYTGSVAWITKIPTVTLVNSESFHGTIQYAYKETGLFSLFTGYTDGLPTAAGEYTIKAHIEAEGNYTEADSTNTMTLTINRADNSINNSSTTSKYYGESFLIEYSIVNKDTTQPTFTCEYKERSAADSTYTTTLPTNAGEYTMRVSATATQNYNACSATQDFVINKAPLDVTGGTAKPKKWDGTKTATVTGLTFKNALTSTPLVGDEALAIGTDFIVTKAEYIDANVNTAIIKVPVVLQNTTKANNYFLQQSNYVIAGSPIALADGPVAPTFSTMNDEMGKDTFTFNSTGATVYQYSKDSGAIWTDITASGATTAITVGNIALAAGALQVRVKATATHNASAVLANTAAQVFTVSIDGTVAIGGTATYGETLTATVSGTQAGAVLKYQWKAGDENIGTNSTTLAIPGSAIGKVITVEVTATGYEGKLTTATNAVAKKAVTATAETVSKVYDGTTAVETADRTLTITKVNASDDITVTAPGAKYNNANVNTNKAITLGDLSISGTEAGWYAVTAPTTVTGEITAKELTDATVTVGGTYTYTGSAITPTAENITVKDGATTLVSGTDYDYAASNNTIAGTATLTVTLKGNYSGTASNTFTIAKADPTYRIPTGLTAKYGQTLSDVNIGAGFSWMDGTTNVGGVGTQTHKVRFTPADTANYNTIENLDVTVTVGKADAFALYSSAVMVKKQANYTVKLDMAAVSGYPAILGGTPAFAIAGSTSNGLTSATIDVDGKTLVLVANNTTNSTADTVTVSVTDMGNYEDSTITVAVSYTDKTTVTITGVTVQDGTYHGGTQKGYIGTPTSAFTGSYDVTYTGRDGTTYNSANAPKNAGDYTVTISVPDSDATYCGSISLNFTVNKATVTIKADNKSAYAGDTQPALTYTATGLATGESLQTVPTLTCTSDMSKAGSYEIIASGAAVPNTDNYNSDITYTKGTLTVSTRPSSGGGGSDSSSDGNVVIIPSTPTEKDPTPPTKIEIKAPATVDNNGNASITVPDKTVANAIKKAQAEAKKNGTEKNGVAVELKVDTGKKTPDSISANLPKVVQDSLVREKVAEFKITSSLVDLTFDSKTLQEIQKQAGGDAVINASKADVSKLSKEAQKEIGNRPVFNLSITGKDGKNISDFGGGSATVSIPYTLQPGENPNNLQAYFVDAKGKLHEVTSTYDPVTKCMVFVTNHFSTYGIGYKENAPKFSDIEKHWAKDDIEFVSARGLLSGTGDGKFSPNTAMTRGMFVTALGRLAGADISTYKKSSFTDVKTGSYYLGYIEWASKNGIVKGTSEATFAPDQAITREQMATIIANHARVIGFPLPTVYNAVTFADNGSIANWAAEAVKSMQMAGILMGKDGGKFDPQGTATRAEVSAMLKRFVELAINSDTAEGLAHKRFR